MEIEKDRKQTRKRNKNAMEEDTIEVETKREGSNPMWTSKTNESLGVELSRSG